MHRLVCHAQLSHLLLVDLFNGRVSELFVEDVKKGIPSGISISQASLVGVVIVGWDIPIAVVKVYPLVLCRTFEERGGKHHHLGVEREILSKHFEVHLTVSEESVDVVVLPLEPGRDH